MAQLLSNLPIGAKVKFGKHSVNTEAAQPIIWLVVAKNHTGYPSNSVTLLTEKAIDSRCFDGKESTSPIEGAPKYGLCRYDFSNIRQWLNSAASAGEWYAPMHEYDTPPTNVNSNRGTGYDGRPGFLNTFTDSERNSILSTTLPTWNRWTQTSSVTDKVFIPSYYELSTKSFDEIQKDGSTFEYFSNGQTLYCQLTLQAFTNSLSHYKPNTIEDYDEYWTRSIIYDSGESIDSVCAISPVYSDGYAEATPFNGAMSVRPALNLSSTNLVSNVVDSDGCYTMVWNSAPSSPITLNVPTIYGGKSNTISWSKVTDPDGDVVTYQLECSINGGEYTQIYSGIYTNYAHLVPFGTTSVVYRVKAIDPLGESSSYTTSATTTVVNNHAPVISGTDAEFGVKSSGFTGTYTVTDANNNVVTVTEAIDGVQIRSLVATLGKEITYGITDNTWLALPNGSHTFTIRATDGIDTSVRTYTFTKLVKALKIQNANPWVASTMPTRIMLVVTRNIPPDATFKVEVCNNGYDTSPTWEDCTDAIESGLVHVFTNKTKSASNWGVLVRVTVVRNDATGACYISAIGGNFE